MWKKKKKTLFRASIDSFPPYSRRTSSCSFSTSGLAKSECEEVWCFVSSPLHAAVPTLLTAPNHYKGGLRVTLLLILLGKTRSRSQCSLTEGGVQEFSMTEKQQSCPRACYTGSMLSSEQESNHHPSYFIFRKGGSVLVRRVH